MKTRTAAATLSTFGLLALATACGPARPFDFDGDKAADLVWVDGGDWYRPGAGGANVKIYAGNATDTPAPGDYDGDGSVDIAMIRDRSSWLRADGGVLAELAAPPALDPWGYEAAVPVSGRWAAGGKDVPAWYRASDATWFIAGTWPIKFGRGATNLASRCPNDQNDGDLPAPADYDGDGRTDLAVYSMRTGAFTIRSSRDGSVTTTPMVTPTSTTVFLPVAADYDGVGHAQPAVYELRTSTWHVTGHDPAVFGAGRDYMVVPAVADYNGDGRADRSTFDIDRGTWTIAGSPTLTLPTSARPATTLVPTLYAVARSVTHQKNWEWDPPCP